MITWKRTIWAGVMTVLAVPAFAASPFAGTWNIELDFQGTLVEGVMVINEGADGALSGSWTSQFGESDLEDVKVAGETLTFQREISAQGQSMTLDYQAKLVDGKIDGMILTPQGDLPFTGVKAQEEVTFVGDWNVEMQGRDQQVMQSTLSIKDHDGKLSGTWTSQRGERELENVKIADGVLSFAQTFEREGQSFSMDYSAKIADGKLMGAITTPRGERPFTGTKIETQEEGGEAAQMVKALDADGDGFVQEGEAPAEMQQFFTMIDSNADGKIDAAEMQMVVDFMAQQN